MDFIRVRGARTHNLKSIEIDLPRERLTVITGLSGSGKSSLAFDTLYAEGQRRYVESLSAYARQFLELMEKPDVDSIEGLSPAISIEQKAGSHNPRSTVGTVTEIHDYLRLLFARAGDPYCPDHDIKLQAQSVSQMVDHVLALPEDTRLMILSPLIVGRRGEQHDLMEDLRAQGFVRLRVDGEVHDIDQLPKLAKNKKHTIDVVVDRVKVRPDVKQRLAESFETALRHSDGRALAVEIDSGHEHIFSARFACPLCSYSLPELEPRLFSFNNPMGACPRCDGLGSVSFFDPARVVAFPSLPLASGAVKGWDRRNQFYFQMLQGLSAHYGFDLETPFEQLPEAVRKVVLYGSGRDKIRFTYSGERGRSHTREHAFEGVVANLERRYKETESAVVREELAKYLNTAPCPECAGSRLRREARHVFVGEQTIFGISRMRLRAVLEFFDALELASAKRSIPVPLLRTPPDPNKQLKLTGASGNNLKQITLDLPLGLFVCVTGVSGSGKSTLVNDTLYQAVARHLYGSTAQPAAFEDIQGLEQIDKVVSVDQSPIGRTPRSNPATYTGLFTPIRDLFAGVPLSRERGYGPGRFSFNVKGGRCEACQGDGVLKVEMHFLPDIYVPCDVCHGRRYNRETLEIQYKGRNIQEVLEMTVEQAHQFFNAVPAIERKLQTLLDVGLGYVKLGQSATTLSGGEAQRVKLALELSKRDTGSTLYILDEPTTGLHFRDIELLLGVLHRLRDHGNTVVVIEHNLDVIKTADWLVDLGPEGGDGGGSIVAQGTPEHLAEQPASFTGQYLKSALGEAATAPPKAAIVA
jgi:excinuclease UvrABC ATPase subunit